MIRFTSSLASGALILGLVACQQPAAPAETPAAAPPTATAPATAPAPAVDNRIAVSLDPEGLRLVVRETGSTRLLAFGTPSAQVQSAIAPTREGAVQEGTNSECGAGPLDFAQWNDLTLWFQGGNFVGWASNSPGPSTLTGVGVGSTRVQLQSSGMAVTFEQTSLGNEFTSGDIHGIVDEGGVVSNLWAGVSCNFR